MRKIYIHLINKRKIEISQQAYETIGGFVADDKLGADGFLRIYESDNENDRTVLIVNKSHIAYIK